MANLDNYSISIDGQAINTILHWYIFFKDPPPGGGEEKNQAEEKNERLLFMMKHMVEARWSK